MTVSWRDTPLNPANPAHSDHLISTNGRRAERVMNHLSPLRDEVQDILLRYANASDNEVCGLITVKQEVFPIENVHEEPRHNFFMDFESCSEVLNEILNIRKTHVLGIFHTHPNNQPWPSPRDIVGWPNPQLKWRYWVITRKEVYEWRLV